MNKKAGRPKLAKGKARGRFISTRLSPGEYHLITEAVRRSHTPKTEWVRNALIEAAERGTERKDGAHGGD